MAVTTEALPRIAQRTALSARLRGAARRLWPESGAVSPIPALDGLRGIAVLLTLVYHAWSQLPNRLQRGYTSYDYAINYGRTGVHLFFVLSGFLLFLPYARWLFGIGAHPSTLLFYRRRILRIGPAYWICLIILLVAGPITSATLLNALAHVFLISNAFPSTVEGFNSVFWTMAVEVQFYAILPLLGLIAYALARVIRPAPAAIVLVLGMVGVSLGLDEIGRNLPIVHNSIPYMVFFADTSLPFWLQVFAGGIACSVLYTVVTQVLRPRLRDLQIIRTAATALLVLGVLGCFLLAFLPQGRALTIKNLLFGICYAALLLGVLLGPRILRRGFESRSLRCVGLISYSFYIWHTIVLAAILPLQLTFATLPLRVAAGVVIGLPISLAAAYVSFQFTERPFFSARKRAHDPARIVAAAPAAQ